MKSTARCAMCALLVMSLGGCATIFSQSEQTISVRTEPAGARVTIGPHVGTSPETFLLRKGENFIVEASRGTQVRAVALTRKFDPIGWINILFPPGFIVDAVTGAMWKYEPDQYVLTFEPTAQPAGAPAAGTGQ